MRKGRCFAQIQLVSEPAIVTMDTAFSANSFDIRCLESAGNNKSRSSIIGAWTCDIVVVLLAVKIKPVIVVHRDKGALGPFRRSFQWIFQISREYSGSARLTECSVVRRVVPRHERLYRLNGLPSRWNYSLDHQKTEQQVNDLASKLRSRTGWAPFSPEKRTGPQSVAFGHCSTHLYSVSGRLHSTLTLAYCFRIDVVADVVFVYSSRVTVCGSDLFVVKRVSRSDQILIKAIAANHRKRASGNSESIRSQTLTSTDGVTFCEKPEFSAWVLPMLSSLRCRRSHYDKLERGNFKNRSIDS